MSKFPSSGRIRPTGISRPGDILLKDTPVWVYPIFGIFKFEVYGFEAWGLSLMLKAYGWVGILGFRFSVWGYGRLRLYPIYWTDFGP
ncbi:hypothetical protein PVK06_022005 [Gossypium arboreum]|uniref:Uncharacterized protein n=1 Tax=Gossypium arboreum TaxID=29729 RepID=A0ABR0PSF1_GOSAR|nr:hypothetical protein PVK06_022005 [Gossypium arboreum]